MATRTRLTKKIISDLSTDKARTWVYDSQVSALAVMVTAAGAKSFYAVKQRLGRQHIIRLGGVDELTVDMARRRAADIVMEVMSGNLPVVKKRDEVLLLSTAFEEYFGHCEIHRKPGTVKCYKWMYEKYIKDWASSLTVPSLNRRAVTELHSSIGERNGKYIANRVLTVLKAVLNRAIIQHELAILNPAVGVEPFKERSRTRRISAEELPSFFKAVEEEPNLDIRDFILLLLFTGVRKGNLLTMRWSCIDFDRRLWVIPAEEAKGGCDLPVALTQPVLDILEDRRHRIGGIYVFPGRRNAEHMMDPKVGWVRILKRAGLANLRMHDLRRSLASFQIDTGTPIEVIQKTLGHQHITTTQIYARLAMDPVRASMERATEEILSKAHSSR